MTHGRTDAEDTVRRVGVWLDAYGRDLEKLRAGRVVMLGDAELTAEFVEAEIVRLTAYRDAIRAAFPAEAPKRWRAKPGSDGLIRRTGPLPRVETEHNGGRSHVACGGGGCDQCSGTGMRTVGAQYLENVFGEVAGVEPRPKVDQVVRKPAPPMEAPARGPAVQASFGW